MEGPLSGVRVIDLTSMISGPVATMILGDQGADVIKVEPPGIGDLVRRIGRGRGGIAPIFLTSNRSKRSIAIDLKREEGRALLLRLVSGADVFVQNFRPGTAERMGLGEAVLRERREDLIYVSISGFGERGPYAHKRVYDPVIQALSGLAAIQADRATGRPRMIRTIVPDKVTALTAAQAITAALLARERSGRGQHVRLAMLDATVSFLWPEGMARYTLIHEGDRSDGPAGGGATLDLVFETADGYMTAGTVSDAEWEGLARATGHTEWLEDPRFETATGRVTHWDARLSLVADALKTRPTSEWIRLLDAEQVPCAPVNTRRDVLTDPQVTANELIVEGDHPVAGPMRQARPAARFGTTPAGIRRPAPALGEHTDEILSELDLSDGEIARLRSAGTVA